MASLQAIAEKLVYLTTKSDGALQEIIRIFRDEYGIDVVTVLLGDVEDKNISAENIRDEIARCLAHADKQQSVAMNALENAKKSKPYVPRKIGNPRGFPPNMRRRK